VRSEIESTHLYARVAQRVRNPSVRELLERLAAEEERHEHHLMELYRRMLGGEEPSLPARDARDKRMELDPDADYVTVITAARDKELGSEAFYQEASGKVLDHKTRIFFLELAEAERRHAADLDEQLARLEKDPHWFDREDPFKPTHLGP
ncbi:MAG: ferritin family protein, partial [Planctomycetota bacterium]